MGQKKSPEPEKLLSSDDVVKLIRLESYNYNTLAEMGQAVGMYGGNISDVLNRRKGVSRKLPKLLGLREVKYYVPIEEKTEDE